MPDDNPTDTEKKLQKLGQRVRDGFAKKNPTTEKSLETVRDAVREQWEKERRARPTPPSPSPGRNREPEEPGDSR
ncbi:MAG: hypothetical protein HY299_02685 [Verrucomicrobia bacterium]|nr:hypothetical protein [Verrucomicrobiota bacterium]